MAHLRGVPPKFLIFLEQSRFFIFLVLLKYFFKIGRDAGFKRLNGIAMTLKILDIPHDLLDIVPIPGHLLDLANGIEPTHFILHTINRIQIIPKSHLPNLPFPYFPGPQFVITANRVELRPEEKAIIRKLLLLINPRYSDTHFYRDLQVQAFTCERVRFGCHHMAPFPNCQLLGSVYATHEG